MSIITKSAKIVTTVTGAVLGSKVAKENGLKPEHGIAGGALLGYGVGALVVDGARAIRNTAATIMAVAKELQEAEKASQEEQLPHEEEVNEIIDSVE